MDELLPYNQQTDIFRKKYKPIKRIIPDTQNYFDVPVIIKTEKVKVEKPVINDEKLEAQEELIKENKEEIKNCNSNYKNLKYVILILLLMFIYLIILLLMNINIK